MIQKKIKNLIVIAVAVVFALIIAINCFTIVDAGHTGVVVTLGRVNEGVLQEGIHFKAPFVQNVVKIDNRIVSLRLIPRHFLRTFRPLRQLLLSTTVLIPLNHTASIKISVPIMRQYL